MFFLFVQLRRILQVVHPAVDPDPDISALPGVRQQVPVFTLPAAHQRGKDLHPGSLRAAADQIHNFVHRLLPDFAAALRAVGNARPRPKQAQIVMDFRDRAHRGTRVPSRGFLVDRDRGAQPVDAVHVRLVHLAQELPGVAGQAFHIAALAFRVDRIKSQGAFSAPAQSCNNRQFVPRYFYGDIFQVVFPGPPDLKIFIHDLDSLFRARALVSMVPRYTTNFCQRNSVTKLISMVPAWTI